MPNALSDRHLLTLVAAILHGADRIGSATTGRPMLRLGDTVADGRDLMATVDRALAPRSEREAATDAALNRLILSPERLDRMLDDALTAYEASLAATLDSFGSLDRGDRRTAMRAALAAALWGAPP